MPLALDSGQFPMPDQEKKAKFMPNPVTYHDSPTTYPINSATYLTNLGTYLSNPAQHHTSSTAYFRNLATYPTSPTTAPTSTTTSPTSPTTYLTKSQPPDALTTSSKAPSDIPDGGLQAWLQVFGSWAILVATWGLVNSYGVFQAYYETKLLPDQSSSSISWIGSLQGALLFLVSVRDIQHHFFSLVAIPREL